MPKSSANSWPEEQVLRDLYAPLDRQIGAASADLRKLALVVEREVDAAAWIAAGEELLDLRKVRGWLEGVSGPLVTAWRNGDAAAVGTAMATFRKQHSTMLTGAMPPADQADAAHRRDWLRRLAQWLYGTGHVRLRYGLHYDGTDISALSPGTRGVVLLLLMLALDDTDPRPLLIDQPEENLDPQSIQEVLVPLFREARRRRQVIMVTHNANLVVNADVDQVIVATCGLREGAGLPPMSHEGGSLDEENVRDRVCRILEGGEAAFRERARRLRLPG